MQEFRYSAAGARWAVPVAPSAAERSPKTSKAEMRRWCKTSVASKPSVVTSTATNLLGEVVELYGFSDLNAEMKFQKSWVVLCEDKLIIFNPENPFGLKILISKKNLHFTF